MVVRRVKVCGFNGLVILLNVLVSVVMIVVGLRVLVVIPITMVCTDVRETRSGFIGFRCFFGSVTM